MLNKLVLKDSIKFNGSQSELKELIRFNKECDIRLEWIDSSTFKFVSNISLGTLIVNYFPVEGIKGYAKIEETQSGKTKLDLRTNIRIELYLFILIAFILISVGLFSNANWPIWTITLFPAGLICFWWIYRIQEKSLFKRLKIYLNAE